jgi:branched-chain amino acid transport system permease protein
MRRYIQYIIIGILILALLTAPLFIPGYYLGLLILALIWGIFAMSLDVLMGYTGMPSLGHAAFFGVAAYTIGILDTRFLHISALQIGIALCVTLVIAAFFGLLALRSRGVYFLMITLALSMVLWGLASNWQSLTGGHDGLAGISRPVFAGLPVDLSRTSNFYYFVLLVFVVAVLLVYLIVRSPFGVALLGIKESETRMTALGYNVWLLKYLSFVITGLFAGVAGILLAYYNGFAHPSLLGLDSSSKVLVMTILGGPGTLFGPLGGAAVIVLLENVISAYTERWQMILGAIYIAVIVCAPQGLYGPLGKSIRRLIRWNRLS